MKRTSKILLAIVLTFALVTSFAAVASAAVTYTPINGTTYNFNKNLVVESDADVPAASFEFTIAPGTPVTGSSSALEILAGPTAANAPTVEAATFTGSETTTAGTPTDNTDTTSKFVTDSVTVDFTGVQFTKPGVYRYVISETPTTLAGFTNDPVADRYLDVFVIYNNGALQIQGYTLRKAATNINPRTGEYETNPGDKTEGYTNTYACNDLEFTKAITGNQADMNKKFKFTLNIEDANPGTYALEITGDNVVNLEDTGSDIVADNGNYAIQVGADGTATAFFYLTNADDVKVIGLPAGYSYTLTEDAEDYDSTAANVTGYTDPTSGTDVNADVKTSFTNDRNGIIPTGVIIMIAPFAIGLLVFGAIILYMTSKRRRVAY